MDPPLTSTELRAFEPVLRMGCATNMMKFYAEKDMKHHTPYIDSFELLKCYSKCWEDMNRTEEAKTLFNDHMSCMKKNPDDYILCKPLRQALEEVAVKYRFGEIPVVERARKSYFELAACLKGKPSDEHHQCRHLLPQADDEVFNFFLVSKTEDFFNSLELPPKEAPKNRLYQVLQHP